MLGKVALSVSIAISVISPVQAQDTHSWQNELYGYSVVVPSRFKMKDPGNDGWTFTDHDGAEILVFAVDLLTSTFEGEASNKIVHAMDSGWEVHDSLVEQERASFAATQGGRVLHAYGIWLCNDTAVFMNFKYDQGSSAVYAPVLVLLKESLKPSQTCQLSRP